MLWIRIVNQAVDSNKMAPISNHFMHVDVWLLPGRVHSRCSLLHAPVHQPNASDARR